MTLKRKPLLKWTEPKAALPRRGDLRPPNYWLIPLACVASVGMMMVAFAAHYFLNPFKEVMPFNEALGMSMFSACVLFIFYSKVEAWASTTVIFGEKVVGRQTANGSRGVKYSEITSYNWSVCDDCLTLILHQAEKRPMCLRVPFDVEQRDVEKILAERSVPRRRQ